MFIILQNLRLCSHKTKKRKLIPLSTCINTTHLLILKEKNHSAQTGEIISTALDPMFPENPFIT